MNNYTVSIELNLTSNMDKPQLREYIKTLFFLSMQSSNVVSVDVDILQ